MNEEPYLPLEEGMNSAEKCLEKAERDDPDFREKASGFVLSHLNGVETASGEDITDLCKRAGIVPHNDHAFGAVFGGLARRRLIVRVGDCRRRKGHGAHGGSMWKLAEKYP